MSTRVQVILDNKVKAAAEIEFDKFGLSLNEGIRFFLASFINGKARIDFRVGDEYVSLSEKAKQRLRQTEADIKAGRDLYELDLTEPISGQIEEFSKKGSTNKKF
jgi:antitoxin component of RelBE/YafQ-DinJ toxin-antitoxin module